MLSMYVYTYVHFNLHALVNILHACKAHMNAVDHKALCVSLFLIV